MCQFMNSYCLYLALLHHKLLWITVCPFFCTVRFLGQELFFTSVPHFAQSLDQKSVGYSTHQVNKGQTKVDYVVPGKLSYCLTNRLPINCGLRNISPSSFVYLTFPHWKSKNYLLLTIPSTISGLSEEYLCNI